MTSATAPDRASPRSRRFCSTPPAERRMTRQAPRLLLAASGSQASRHAPPSRRARQHVRCSARDPARRPSGRVPRRSARADPADQPTARRPADQPRAARGAPSRVGTRNERKDDPRRRRPARVIVTVARDLGADLLVIGSTPGLMPSALAAKTRRWLDKHAPCPVLPVTADRPALAQPGLEPIVVT